MSEETAGAEKSTGERRGFRLWRAWGLVTSSFALHTRQKYSSEKKKKKRVERNIVSQRELEEKEPEQAAQRRKAAYV